MKKLLVACLLMSASVLGAVEYDIQDIGTLQTHTSQAVDMNNEGQILGWYQVDSNQTGKRFFVRDRDGSFEEIPTPCEWKYITNSGKVYGFTNGGPAYSWDKSVGVKNLGNPPKGLIVKVNDLGQMLIQSLASTENGNITQPVIWQNGTLTKLRRLAGNTGIESEEAYGLDMNNRGEVVGKSLVHVVYKNKVYKCSHATMWVNGEAIDLHNEMPKSKESYIFAINDSREMLALNSSGRYFISNIDNTAKAPSSFTVSPKSHYQNGSKINNNGLVYLDNYVFENINGINPRILIGLSEIANQMLIDKNSIWWSVTKFVKVNDNGEILAQGQTVYGEDHALLLTPAVKSK